MLLEPPLLVHNACAPTATLLIPVVLHLKAFAPTAVGAFAEVLPVLLFPLEYPMAVMKFPIPPLA